MSPVTKREWQHAGDAGRFSFGVDVPCYSKSDVTQGSFLGGGTFGKVSTPYTCSTIIIRNGAGIMKHCEYRGSQT